MRFHFIAKVFVIWAISVCTVSVATTMNAFAVQADGTAKVNKYIPYKANGKIADHNKQSLRTKKYL